MDNLSAQRVRRRSLRSASAGRRKLHLRSRLLPFRTQPAFAGLASGSGNGKARRKPAERLRSERTNDEVSKPCRLRRGAGCAVREDEMANIAVLHGEDE